MPSKPRNTQSVTMAVNRGQLNRGREADINLSATLSTAQDAKLCYNAKIKWQEDIIKALESLNRFHDENVCFSEENRTF